MWILFLILVGGAYGGRWRWVEMIRQELLELELRGVSLGGSLAKNGDVKEFVGDAQRDDFRLERWVRGKLQMEVWLPYQPPT